MKILHVTECFAGGVASALEIYAQLLPEHDHVLLSCARRAEQAHTPSPGLFSKTLDLPMDHLGAIRELQRVVRAEKPDVVHAHSSFGGAYARARSLPVPVVYTPHGLSFERQDVSAPKRRVFRGIEKVLAGKTTVFAPCSVREGQLLAQLNGKVPQVVIPNAVRPLGISWHPSAPATVGIAARIAPQRNPEFFAQIAKLAAERGHNDIRFVWLGGGEEGLTQVLRDAGVEVTGWLPHKELHSRMSELAVGLHTALWDGFPMSVLEMNDIGLPVLVQDIPALQECPEEARFSTPEDAVDKINYAIANPGSILASWKENKAQHSIHNLHSQLQKCYDLAVAAKSK